MPIKAVVFDIGGVLEVNPRTGWEAKWEAILNLQPGELDQRLMSVWKAGDTGEISESQVEASVAQILGLGQAHLDAFMGDLWHEYVGTLNVELAAYFASLRPRYKTAILSNSFVGARRKEQELYGFEEMCDLIVYSHEVGVKKPDRRIYELLCERLGVRPSEIIFLDDVEAAVTAARALGIHAILFKDTAQAIADVEACLGHNASSY